MVRKNGDVREKVSENPRKTAGNGGKQRGKSHRDILQRAAHERVERFNQLIIGDAPGVILVEEVPPARGNSRKIQRKLRGKVRER